MVRVFIGVMVLVAMLSFNMCKYAMAIETSPTQQQGTIGGGTIGDGGENIGGKPSTIEDKPASHPDKTKEKDAEAMESGAMKVIPNSGYGQYPMPVPVTGQGR